MMMQMNPVWERLIRKLCHIVLIASGVLILLEVSFHLIVAPHLKLQNISIQLQGPSSSENEIYRLLDLKGREYYFSVSEKDLQMKLEAQTWLSKVKITKKFPDTLIVQVSVRQPIALSMVQAGGRTILLTVDEEGVVFDVKSFWAGQDLPIISGVTFDSLKPGVQFPEELKPLFDNLKKLKKEEPSLYARLGELKVRPNNSGGFDTLIYPLQGPVRLIFPETWDRTMIRQAFVMIDVAKQQGWASKTKEIDFRTTAVVLRPRES